MNDGLDYTVTQDTQELNPVFTKDKDGFYIPPPGVKPDIFMKQVEEYLERENKKSTAQLEWRGAVSVNGGIEKGVDDATPIKLLEGSITKRKDGRWMGQYYDHGTKKTVYARSKLDVVNKVNDCVRLRNQNAEADRRGVAKKATLAEFIDVWFDEWIQAKSRSKPLSNNTIQNVRFTLFKYIHESKISKKLMAKITESDIDKMIDEIPTKSMQARTFGYLKAVFDKAVIKKIIKASPFKFVEKRVRPARKKKYIPDTKTLHEFLDWLKTEAVDCYYLGKFIIGSGMRMGEVLALTWADIDLDNKRASVNKAFSQADNAVVDHPKTDAGFRNAPLFDDAIEVLKEIPVNKNTNEIFWMLSKRHITHRFPEKAIKYGLPRLPIHNLRHYYASLCAAMGVDKKTYSLWMGHSDIVQTDDYTHNLSEFEQEQILKMAKSRIK